MNRPSSVIGSVCVLSRTWHLLVGKSRHARPGRALATLILGVCQVACSTSVVTPYEPPAPAYALPAQPGGVFAGLEEGLNTQHGAGYSGFTLIDRNEEGLRWRLALIDSARHSIDFQYYLWYGDAAGKLIATRLLDAADRGVRVRVLIDDLNTLLRDASSVVLRDEAVAWLDAHPNIEVRLFNPWSQRDFRGRVGEGLSELDRVNRRMHNKALIADNRAVILGGRNIGDEYMGLNTSFNFHDLDVLGVGPVARQTSAVFDAFWNSHWVMPVAALQIDISRDQSAAARAELVQDLSSDPALPGFPVASQDWGETIANLREELHAGTSRVISDLPDGNTIEHVMLAEIRSLMARTQSELLIVNAYIIPTETGIGILRERKADGAVIRILTNSLASHDVPAVNSHYAPWRKPIVASGAELYELRSDAGIRSGICDTPPTRAGFVGLHSKAMVVDREWSYIGSMNFDPRSAALNSEMGVIVRSPGLGEALARLIERDMRPANSWQVTLDQEGRLQWTNDTKTVHRQPARNAWQRVEEFFFRGIPKEYY